MDWLDTYSDPSVKAASVVTNLWVAAFSLASAVFALLGGIVALQWPNPRILCYKTSYSDTPNNSTRSCCSLYSLNLGFTVFWLLVFAIMVIARDVVRIIICLSFWVVHVAVVLLFRMKFKRYGRPERPFNSSLEMGTSGSAAAAASLGPGQAVGIPVYNIPMQTVVIGPRIDGSGSTAAGGPSSQPPPYQQWYDADCLPPASGTNPHSGAAPAPAGAAGGGYFGGPGPYPVAAAAYPPQPAASPAGAAGPDGSGFVLGQPVTGLPAVLAPTTQAAGAGAAAAAAAAGAAGGRASLEASGHVGATAGAAAAAGAGPVGATGQQQQPQQPR